MTTARPHPFPLLFGGLDDAHFPAIHAALGPDPSLDHFLLAEPALTLLQALRPEATRAGEEGGADFAMLGYAAYRYWEGGQRTRTLTAAETRSLCRGGARRDPADSGPQYIQVAPHLIWASLDGGEQHEPLDGWFVVPQTGPTLMVALFGVHPARPGVSVLAVAGTLPATPMGRPDGTAAFAATMAGGAEAGLHALATEEEVLTLAWRVAGMEER